MKYTVDIYAQHLHKLPQQLLRVENVPMWKVVWVIFKALVKKSHYHINIHVCNHLEKWK